MRKIESVDQFRSKKAGIGILVALYVLTAFGYRSALGEWFVFLTPVLWFVTAGMIWIDSKPGNRLGWPIALTLILLGYAVEVIGVQYTEIFGSYTYGNMLGWKFFGVPPVIGIEWLILTWGGYALARPFELNPLLRALAAALVGTGLFWLMQPVLQAYGILQWQQNPIPFKNYAARFGLLLIFALIFDKYPLVTKPRMGQTAALCQFLFFIWLRIKLK